jgi:hypothetical protein
MVFGEVRIEFVSTIVTRCLSLLEDIQIIRSLLLLSYSLVLFCIIIYMVDGLYSSI